MRSKATRCPRCAVSPGPRGGAPSNPLRLIAVVVGKNSISVPVGLVGLDTSSPYGMECEMRKRDDWIKIRVSAEEKTQWQDVARSRNLTVADLIRASIGSERPVGREPRRSTSGRKADPFLIANLGRIGSLLGQIANWANTQKSGADAVQIILALIVIEKLLLSYSREKPRSDHVE